MIYSRANTLLENQLMLKNKNKSNIQSTIQNPKSSEKQGFPPPTLEKWDNLIWLQNLSSIDVKICIVFI